MAEDNGISNNLKFMGMLLLLSTISLGLGFVMVVAGNDYVYAQVYSVASDMVIASQMNPQILTDIETVSSQFLGILPTLDKFWAACFVGFIWMFLRSSYLTKRMGYTSIFGILTIGIIFMLWGLNIIVQVNDVLYDVLFNQVLNNLTVSIPFFEMYMTNFQTVNLFLIVAGVVANFVDLDNVNFFKRKDKENFEGGEILG